MRGGFNVPAAGLPPAGVEEPPATDRLLVPLTSRRFTFTDVRVDDGQSVSAGQVLAVDPDRYDVPLLAPASGTARLSEAEGHVVLVGLGAGSAAGEALLRGGPDDRGSSATTSRLVELGVWQFLSDARTGEVVDPDAAPAGIIATALRLEPFLAGGEAQLRGALDRLARGLTSLAALAPDAPLFVVVPDCDDPLASELRETAVALKGAHVVVVPLRFPFDEPAHIARVAGLPSGLDDVVWALRAEGVLAVDAALNEGRPATERVVSVAGPAVGEPVHVRAPLGYPVEGLLHGRLCRQPARVVNGGLLTGETLAPGQLGLDCECAGLTVLAEPTRQTLVSFARPGVSRRSYSRTFVGTLRTDMAMRYRAALSGELRPCISCGQCTDVCPAGILPGVIHKHLYADRIEEAQRLRVDLCIGCGLCSFVCPSKIDLRRQILAAAGELREEARTIRAEQAAAEEAARLAEESEPEASGPAGETGGSTTGAVVEGAR